MSKCVDKNWLEEAILPLVEKPIRYTGGELNSIVKDHEECSVRFAFGFPDVYEVAMSHLGTQILYKVVNDHEDFCMERVFCPWVDMQEKMKENDIPLYTLETFTEVKDFDFLGFTLQYEMSYTNILSMLELAKIPFYREERMEGNYPLVLGGGPCAFNPEPIADFFDLFLIGDAEETILELFSLYAKVQAEGGDRVTFLKKACKLPGIYVPEFYDVSYSPDGVVEKFEPLIPEAPAKVVKSLLKDLELATFPDKPIVPYMDIIHDRIMLEVLRGCTHGCRFCQAGVLYRPVRERSKELLLKQAKDLMKNTGHEDISLTSLSTADHTQLNQLVDELQQVCAGTGVGISLPSLRVDTFSMGMAKKIASVRKTGLTFAPEAGTQRMRDIINKGVTEENLMKVSEDAFRAGWERLKLYFMIGLPFERDEDLEGIVHLGNKVIYLGKRVASEIGSKRKISVTLSASSFVPKPFTPFQWIAQDPLSELERKQRLIKEKVRTKNLVFNYHNAKVSHMEAAFAKGDRRLSKALVAAHKKGCRYDGWDEFFNFKWWQEAFEECGLTSSDFAQREFKENDILPWDFIDTGVRKSFLYAELLKAKSEELTPDCRDEGCNTCGVCMDMDCDMLLQEEVSNEI
ncbi:TIGR03960 family B12-binding radical SAM protein [Clostridia bacterium]|nr:TIGR03960 family B12-binding radical SAM protein [Clostridia bacterium]